MTATRVLAVGKPQPAFGHRTYIGARQAISIDNQAALVPMVIAERRRRALYADCERAPAWTDRHRNLFPASHR